MRSKEVLLLRASSTSTAPSLPALSTAVAMRVPIPLSLLAEMVAICMMSSTVSIGLDNSPSFPTIASTALSIPRFNSTGEAPDVTYFWPSLRIARANTVDVVVPSPAVSTVCFAACLMICAPRFWNGSSSSTKFATVTPSFVITGIPCSAWNMATVLPRGPSVAATLSAKMLTPSTIDWLREEPCLYCFIESPVVFRLYYNITSWRSVVKSFLKTFFN